MNKYIKIKEFVGCMSPRLEDMVKCVKEAGIELSTAFIETEIDYSGCYYEGDMPSVSIVLYGKK
jgi:hypothetical protein